MPKPVKKWLGLIPEDTASGSWESPSKYKTKPFAEWGFSDFGSFLKDQWIGLDKYNWSDEDISNKASKAMSNTTNISGGKSIKIDAPLSVSVTVNGSADKSSIDNIVGKIDERVEYHLANTITKSLQIQLARP